MISVLISTLNEERDLPGCLASVAWSDDVHVFDSFSSDRTVSLAEAAGARVTQRRFDNYASHRNAGLALPTIRYEWVLILDADERMTDSLRREMAAALHAADPKVAAFRMRRRDYFLGRWLRHAQISPYTIRLFRRGAAHYEREVNERVCVRGEIQDLQESFDHFPFSKGLAHWLDRHNRYSTMEAGCASAAQADGARVSIWRAFFTKDFNERRFYQKALFCRLPARPLVKLIYMLFVRGAILDGKAGIRYALLQAVYEWFIVLKMEEDRERRTDPPATPSPGQPAPPNGHCSKTLTGSID